MHSKLPKFLFMSSVLGVRLRKEQITYHKVGGTLGLYEQINDYKAKPLYST